MATWIAGSTRSGKTTRLINQFKQWVETRRKPSFSPSESLASAVLVFAANDDNRRELADKLSRAIQGSYPVICKTPLGFFADEVMLFWPLLFEKLNLKAQFPLRLRPETEQELATRLWRSLLENRDPAITEYRYVRRLLDLLQLAGASGIEAEQIPSILQQGLPEQEWSWQDAEMDELLHWRRWCLERGLLSYGIICELYWRYLLDDPAYHHHLVRRYRAVFADDVDDYPAIARDLFETLLDNGAFGVFTYNPDSQVRLGLNADPHYLSGLASRTQVEELSLPLDRLDLPELAISLVTQPTAIDLPASIQSIQTISRAELLRETAQTIIQAVRSGVKPEEIAIIAPGLDEIARYTLIEILSHQNIPVEPLNEQRPLVSSPLVRALLTLTALVYPGLGRLVERAAVAEMLIILSQTQARETKRLTPTIDPVRAGLLADYCYHVDPDQPRLLPIASFPRWDRLGHRAAQAYQEIVEWIEEAKSQPPNMIALLDRAMERFILSNAFAYDQLAALRELMETAQHYWEVDRRLRQNEPSFQSPTETVSQFIALLRRGTITANPRPMRYLSGERASVTIATIFQYRSLRRCHRWQFWLDASSSLWEKGGAATLFAAPLFGRNWSGQVWMPEDQAQADRERLERILRDLLGRGERVFLCHSDLGVNGTEQTGPLSPLVYASRQWTNPNNEVEV